MKLSLFVAFAAVAAVSSYNPTVNSVVYKPGEEYVYHYKGQVLSGIPKSGKQFAGILIDTDVILQFQQDYKVIMKLDDVKLFKINNKISTLPSEPLSETDVTRLSGEQAEVLKEFLSLPLKFKYEEGEVRELEKETRDRFWSVNIKKGILSVFQISLKEKHSSVDTSLSVDPTMSRIKSYSHHSRSSNPITPSWRLSNKFNSVYKVMETEVTGDCENKYSVITDKTRETSSVSKMLVTVVRNFDSCISKPFYIQGLFQGVYRYPTEKDLIQPMMHTDYVITGDRTHFLIKEATVRGKYIFMMNGEKGGDMSSFVLQSLTLKTTEPIRTPFHLMSPKTETRGLLMVIPKATVMPETRRYEEEETTRGGSPYEVRRRPTEYKHKREYESDEVEEEVEERAFDRDSDDIMTVVERKLSEMVECLYPVMDKKCSGFLLDISRILRQVTKEELKPFLVRYLRGASTTETDYRKSEILLDILPTLPTPDAAKVLVELIRERHISEIRGTLMIKAMSLVVKPTPAVVKSIFDLFKELPKERSSTLTSRTMLRQALLLSVGTVTHRLINVMRSHGKPVPEVISFVDTISGELKRMLETHSEESEKILILKSMGNMGASETLVTLKTIIEERERPLKVRISAVFALRRLSKQMKKQVVPILMSIFMDVKEVHEMRQAALVVVINSNPSFATLQMIAHSLRREPSSQIRTLVYTSLVSLALHTSHEPEHKELSKNARLILKTIPSVRVGVHDTMSVLINKFSEEFDLGGAINVMKIKSKMSGLPEALIANIQTTLFGKHRRLLEFGVEGKALEVVLRKVFGPHGLLKEILKGKVSLRDFLKPLARPDMGGVEHKIREILSKMMLELRSEEEPFASWYMHLLGNELQYIVLDSENIHEIVNKVTRFIPELYEKLTRGIKVDIIKSVSSIDSLTIASPLGVPLSLNFTTMAIFKVDGHVKVSKMPMWSELISRFPVTMPKISLEVDLKPTVDVSHYITLGADMRWLASGVCIESHLRTTVPTKFDIHLNGPEHTISAKYYTPKKTIKLHAKVAPITFIKYIPTTVAKLPFTFETKDITNEEIIKVTPFEYKIREPISTVEFETRGLYSICGPSYCPTMLFGKQEIMVLAHPTTSVEFVHLKIKSLKTNFDIEGVPASRSTEELYGEEEEEENEEERETSEPRESRREKTTNYRLASRRSMVLSGEFESITPDTIFSTEPIKRQILVTLGPNTQETPKVKSLITWLMGRRYMKNQLNVQIVRIAHGDTPAWKVKLNNVVNPLSWYPESNEETKSSEFLCKTHLFWTIYGDEQELKVKVMPGSPIDITRELLEHGIQNADSLLTSTGHKYKYSVEVEMKHMSKRTLRYIAIVQDAIKFSFYNRLTTTIPLTTQTNKILVAVELLPWWEKVNIIVKTPRENSYITDVPCYWNPLFPTSEKIRLHDHPLSTWYKTKTEEKFLDTVPYMTSPIYRDECVVDRKEQTVTTFDGVETSISPAERFSRKGCWSLITQDCSNRGLFSAVTMGNREEWKAKLLMPKYEIELIVRRDTVLLKINGEEKRIHKSQPIMIREERDETSSKLYKIEKFENHLFEVKAYELGLTAFFNMERETLTLKVSPMSMLQGQLCGMCGNNNQDQSDDFEIPSNLKVPSHRSLLLSHLVPSETCDIDRISSTEESL